jgi:hypothetical protein
MPERACPGAPPGPLPAAALALAREDDSRRLSNHVEHLLQDERLADALRLAAEGLQQISLPAAAP